MGNGALPHGPSYRAHPQLYHERLAEFVLAGPLLGYCGDKGLSGSVVGIWIFLWCRVKIKP